jgi:hypothetical protein
MGLSMSSLAVGQTLRVFGPIMTTVSDSGPGLGVLSVTSARSNEDVHIRLKAVLAAILLLVTIGLAAYHYS